MSTSEARRADRSTESPREQDRGGPRVSGLREADGQPARVRWGLVATLALGVAGGLLGLELVTAIIPRVQGLLIVVVLSLFLSFAMEPAVQWMARRGIRRGVGTAVVFLVAFLALAGFVAAMAPLVITQVRSLFAEGPAVLTQLAEQSETLLPDQLGGSVSGAVMEQARSLPDRLPEMAQQVARGALGVGTTLAGGLLQLLSVLLVTFYLVAEGPRLRRTLSSRLEPHRQEELLAVWELAISRTGGYVYSRLVTAVISAGFHTIAFTLTGLDYAVALGLWVGIISSLIPVVGTYLAGALPLLVALASQQPIDALWVLAAVVVYQQVENYVVAPRVNAATMELHPAVAFLSVLVGAALLGVAGALLALPAAAIVAALASTAGRRHEVLDHGLTEDHRSPGPPERDAQATEERTGSPTRSPPAG